MAQDRFLPRQPDSPDGIHYHTATYQRAKQLLEDMKTGSQDFYNQNRKEIFQAQRIVSKVEGGGRYNDPTKDPESGTFEDARHAQARADEPAKRHAQRLAWARQNPNSVARAQDGTVYTSDHNGDLIITKE